MLIKSVLLFMKIRSHLLTDWKDIQITILPTVKDLIDNDIKLRICRQDHFHYCIKC